MTQLPADMYCATITLERCRRLPPLDMCNPTHASTRMEGGKAVFENDNYRITCGDDNEVLIHNKNTGETYRAWGDPHMDVDGQHAFDFWGTTTLALDDGTKVTIETTPWSNNPNTTLASKVTITNGDYGVQVSGVDTNKTGDLRIDEAKGWGRVLDAAVDDGNVLRENRCGGGFVAVDDFGNLRHVDQNYINDTDLQKGGALANQFKDAFRLLSGLMSIAFLGAFLGSLIGARREHDDPSCHRPPIHREPPVPIYWAGGSPTFDETGRKQDPRFELTLVRFSVGT